MPSVILQSPIIAESVLLCNEISSENMSGPYYVKC